MDRGTTATIEAAGLPGEGLWVAGAARRWAITPLLRSLALLVGLFALLAGAYASITHRRSDGANAVSFPLTPGTTIGQTFVSRYPDLSALEVRLNGQHMRGPDSTATLVMRLREAPGAGPDLATSTLHVTGAVQENEYQQFTFPPIEDSLNKSFYVEFDSPGATADNAPALMWWIQFDPNLPTDPYAGGAAYYNGVIQQADIAFGLRHSPAPLDAFRLLAARASSNVPKGLMLLFLAVPALLAAFSLQGVFRRRPRLQVGKPLILRWSLQIALAVAFANGLLFTLLVPPWQGPDEHGHFAYAALLHKHDLDAAAIRDLEWWEGGKDHQEALDLKTAIVSSMGEHDWTRRVSGHPTPGAPAFPPGGADLYTHFTWELRQPVPYYWLAASSVRLANLLGADIDPFAQPAAALRVMRLVSVLLNLLVVGLAWLAGVLLSNRNRWLRLALPLAVALLPMRAFIASVLSNDIISELNVAALFVTLVALVRWPAGWRGIGLLLLAGLLLGAASQTKSTAALAGAPLLALGTLTWLGMHLTAFMQKRIAARALRSGTPADRSTAGTPHFMLVPGIAVAVLFVACLAGVLLLFRQGELVAGWQTSSFPSDRPLRVQTASAHEGGHALQVAPGQPAFQWVLLPWPHEAYSLTLSLWARPAETRSLEPGREIGVAAVGFDRRGTLSRIGAETLPSSQAYVPVTASGNGAWTNITATLSSTNADRKVWITLYATDVPVQFDSISLSMTERAPGGAGHGLSGAPGMIGAPTTLPVFNPSAEIGSFSLTSVGERLVGGYGDIVDTLVNPQVYDKREIWQRYADRQFRSFWGNFGWLSIPLPWWLYDLISALLVLALAGLLSIGALRLRRWSMREWLVLIAVVALGIAILLSFAWQMAPLAGTGVHTDPQGRYIFGFNIPVVWLALLGLGFWWHLLSRIVRQFMSRSSSVVARASAVAGGQASDGPHVSLPWGIWLWCSGLGLFACFALLVLIAPYYYA